MEEITLKNRNSDEIAYIPKFKIGVNIYESLIQPYLSLSILEIDSIRLSDGDSGEVSEPFLIKGSNLKILNNDLQIESKSFSLLFSEENSKAIFHQGIINSYPFIHIEALFDPSSESIYYSSQHSFDSKSITDRNLFNLKAFKSHDINLGFSSKGIFNFGTKESRRFDRLAFKNSQLVNNSEYIIDEINATIFSGKNSLYGLFHSQIPDQMIKGALEVNNNKNLIVRTDIAIDMSSLINSNRYFDISGYEIFNTVMTITQEKASMKLLSDLINTKISSSIDELKKETNEILKTQIFIDNISEPIYEIRNNNIESLIDSRGYGFFSFGKGFEEVIKHKNGFYVYLGLNEIDLNNIFFDSSGSDNSSLRSIKMKSKQFNFLNNTYMNQYFDVTFKDETLIKMVGETLNGSINIDQTNFVKINLNNTKFDFDGIDLAQSGLPSDINNISLRFIGKNIRTEDDIIQDIDFYLLRNKNLLTIDNINIDSPRLKIGPNSDNQKAYISYNSKLDLYKIKGKYRLDNSSGYFNNLSKYKFKFFDTDINIQWNNLDYLKNLEGKLDFLIKDLNLDSDIQESTFLRALRILNLNAIVEGLDDASDNTLNINRASGKIILGKNRALIKSPIIFETDEATLKWAGEVIKNSQGELDKLNLDLSLRLKISENIPWYAAIFGGIPAVAGGLVFENIFEDAIEDISTINFKVQGTIDEPKIDRLN
ncbi:AsmA-like C-terminal region-containing protein [Gammaproteobacteria bacterium]|nr:AsmA-like C-terminal region-containing protein [Gammaproteobacteria bacterium]